MIKPCATDIKITGDKHNIFWGLGEDKDILFQDRTLFHVCIKCTSLKVP